jgi:hypothetical protein
MTSSKRKTSGGRVTPKGTRPPEKSKAAQSKAAAAAAAKSHDESTDDADERNATPADRPRGGGANRPSVPRSAGRTGLRGGR